MSKPLSKARLKPPHFIKPTASVHEAVQAMAKAGAGVLLVSTNGERIEAVLTERDILRGLAREGHEFLRAHVAEFVLHAPITITLDPDTTVEEAARLMERNRIRHLPVLKRGQPIGVLGAVEVFKQLNPGVSLDLKG